MITKNTEQSNVAFLDSAFHEHYEGLHRYAFSITGDNETAKDAVQQVFIALWERRSQFGDIQSVRSYLYRAVHNMSYNLITRNPRNLTIEKIGELEMGPPGMLPVVAQEIKELRLIIRGAIESLPPNCRSIFIKSREEEKSYKVIAKEMGISVKTIEAQITKALKIIRSEIYSYLHETPKQERGEK